MIYLNLSAGASQSHPHPESPNWTASTIVSAMSYYAWIAVDEDFGVALNQHTKRIHSNPGLQMTQAYHVIWNNQHTQCLPSMPRDAASSNPTSLFFRKLQPRPPNSSVLFFRGNDRTDSTSSQFEDNTASGNRLLHNNISGKDP